MFITPRALATMPLYRIRMIFRRRDFAVDPGEDRFVMTWRRSRSQPCLTCGTKVLFTRPCAMALLIMLGLCCRMLLRTFCVKRIPRPPRVLGRGCRQIPRTSKPAKAQCALRGFGRCSSFWSASVLPCIGPSTRVGSKTRRDEFVDERPPDADAELH